MDEVDTAGTDAVFVDGTGRRRRIVTLAGVAAGLVLLGLLGLALAGLFGFTPVPLPGLPASGRGVQGPAGDGAGAPVPTGGPSGTARPAPAPKASPGPVPASSPVPTAAPGPTREGRPTRPLNSHANPNAGRSR